MILTVLCAPVVGPSLCFRSCCCGCLPIAGLVAGALCSVLVIPTLLLGWTGLAIAHFPRNLFYAYYGVFGTKLCVRWLAGWCQGWSRAQQRLTDTSPAHPCGTHDVPCAGSAAI